MRRFFDELLPLFAPDDTGATDSIGEDGEGGEASGAPGGAPEADPFGVAGLMESAAEERAEEETGEPTHGLELLDEAPAQSLDSRMEDVFAGRTTLTEQTGAELTPEADDAAVDVPTEETEEATPAADAEAKPEEEAEAAPTEAMDKLVASLRERIPDAEVSTAEDIVEYAVAARTRGDEAIAEADKFAEILEHDDRALKLLAVMKEQGAKFSFEDGLQYLIDEGLLSGEIDAPSQHDDPEGFQKFVDARAERKLARETGMKERLEARQAEQAYEQRVKTDFEAVVTDLGLDDVGAKALVQKAGLVTEGDPITKRPIAPRDLFKLIYFGANHQTLLKAAVEKAVQEARSETAASLKNRQKRGLSGAVPRVTTSGQTTDAGAAGGRYVPADSQADLDRRFNSLFPKN